MTSETFYETVPLELKQLNNWVGWKLESRNNKLTKIPYSGTGIPASSTDATTWRSFDDVKKIAPTKEKGIGFVFNGNGIVGIDIDHCISENGEISNKFESVIKSFASYTEISPSGTGVHIFIRCSSPPYKTGKKHGGIEIYSTERYFTVTGNALPEYPSQIKMVPVENVRNILEPFISQDKPERSVIRSTQSNTLTDDEIIEIASHARNSSKFIDLMNGHSCGDRSSDDMALANILAFYSSDICQIERIMRMSGLVREKWNRRDYLVDYTIEKAVGDCNTHYEKPNNLGDAEHGKTVADTFLNHSKEAKMTDTEIEDIISASRICNNLPRFPEITHPIFKRWMDVGSRLMYSHPSYHFGNLLAIASMALGRRVGVLIATNYVNANVNVMLVGTSTISGKSFSSDTAVKEFGTYVTDIPTLFNPSDATELKRKSCSNPRLIQDMSLRNNMLWYYDEAKEFFDDCGDRGWNAPIVGTLCTAYDGGCLERSLSTRSSNKKAGRDQEDVDENKWVCENPFLSLLFNMTISQLQEASTPKIVGSGFFYRWMWFLENGGEKKKNVTATAEDIREIAAIRRELVTLGTMLKSRGANDICFNVNDKIEEWSLAVSKKNDDEIYQAATGRSVIHIYKIAMIFTLLDPEFQKTISANGSGLERRNLSPQWVDEAITIVEKYLLPRMLAVADYSKRIDLNNKQLKVLNALISLNGVADHTTLLRKTHLDSTDFGKAISTLELSEEIRHVDKSTKRIYCLIKHEN
jgi:hypothetical protein